MIPDPCTDPCKPKKPCGCIPNQFDHCIIISEDLECIDVERGSKLKKALKAIDEYLCKLKEDINKAGSFIIRNVGGGAELFKGINLTGRRDFRTLKSEDKSVKIVEEEDEINLETPEIETNTPYIQVTRENGVDRVSFSGVGEVISTDGTVNIAVTGGNQYDLTGVQSLPGDTPYIGSNGNWWVGDTDTQVQAQGNQGEDGHTPYVDSITGTWWINGEDTGYTAIGTNGITPHIGNNDNWWIGATDTGYPATGPQGESGIDGDTPHIGSNGNWYIGDVDTTIPATGPQGNPVTVTSEDSTVTVNSQEGGAIVDLSVNIPDSMTIEEANCEGGQTLVEVNGDTAKALCLVSNTVTITREGDSIRLESEGQGATYTGSETIEIDSNNEITRKALTGDVEAPDNSNVTTIKDNAVTYAKIQKVSANKLLGRQPGIYNTGNVQEISIGNNLTLSQAGVLSADVKYEADIRKVGTATNLTYGHNGTTLVLVGSGALIFASDPNTILDPFEVFVVNDTAGPKDIALTATSGWTYRANAEDVTGTVTLDKGGTCVIMRRASDNVILILGDITI